MTASDGVWLLGPMGKSPGPNNVRVRIPERELREAYAVQGHTLDEVATVFGVSPATIRRRMRDVGLGARRRGPASSLDPLNASWTPELAYVVGVIATDGNLAGDGRHLNVSSQDVDLLETVRRCLNLRASIRRCGREGRGHRIQWGSRAFYTRLAGIGLMPAKSLRLGPLRVPDDLFRDFLRGCIDGDDSIVTYRDAYNAGKNPHYVYDRLFVSLVSASPQFLAWIQRTVQRLRGLSGHLTVQGHPIHHDCWRLRYAKRESVSLLTWMYYAPDVPALRRKRERAARAIASATWYRRSPSEFLCR